MTDIHIRKLNGSDSGEFEKFLKKLSPEVYLLWNRFGFSLDEFDPKDIAAKQCAMDEKHEEGFVAVAPSGEFLGYSYLRYFPEKRTKLQNASLGIAVLQESHGKGVGKRLMLYMHDWAEKKGIKKIWLATYSKNLSALRLYRKLGYQIEGVFMYDEKNADQWEHVVSMALFLGDEFKNAKAERKSLIREIENGEGC